MTVGTRIEMHPATNAWITGDRYGAIVKVTPTHVHVKLDRSGRTRPVRPENVLPIRRTFGY